MPGGTSAEGLASAGPGLGGGIGRSRSSFPYLKGKARMEPDPAEAAPSAAQKRKAHPLAPRIKRLMQTDEDVGKIAQATPHLIAMATEKFLAHVAGGAMQIAESRNAKTLQPAHIKAFVHSEAVLDFLKDAVASAPDLPDDDGKPKRKRKSKAKGEATAKVADDGEGQDDPPGASVAKKRPARKGAGAKRKKEEEEDKATDATEPAGDEVPDRVCHAKAENIDGAGDGDAAAAGEGVKAKSVQLETPAAPDTLAQGGQQLPAKQEEIRWHGDGSAVDGGGWHTLPADQEGVDGVSHAAANGGGNFTLQLQQPGPAAALQQTESAQQAPDAAQQEPADGDADDFGDLGEVPMAWLEDPAAVGGGPAVEEEDYD